MVVLGGLAVSYERGTPVPRLLTVLKELSWLPPRMLPHVIQKVGTLSEPLATRLTGMRLFPRMRIHVLGKVA